MSTTAPPNPSVTESEQLVLKITWTGDPLTISLVTVHDVALADADAVLPSPVEYLFRAKRGTWLQVHGEIACHLGNPRSNVKVTVESRDRAVTPLPVGSTSSLSDGGTFSFDKNVTFGP